MKRPLSDQLSIRLLNSMMDEQETSLAQWTAEDLQSILEHQLDTPLEKECGLLAASGNQTETTVSEILLVAGRDTYRETLLKAGAPESLLHLVKDFAKASLADPAGLPNDVSRVLYILAILRARSQGIVGISSLSTEAIGREARRCLTYQWLPQSVGTELRALCRSD